MLLLEHCIHAHEQIQQFAGKSRSNHPCIGAQVERISRNNVTVYKGKVGSDRNSPEIRRLLLAEMVARATKNILRQLLRTSATQCHATTYQTQVMVAESWMLARSSHPFSATCHWSSVQSFVEGTLLRHGLRLSKTAAKYENKLLWCSWAVLSTSKYRSPRAGKRKRRHWRRPR